jgi:hypothetical protein
MPVRLAMISALSVAVVGLHAQVTWTAPQTWAPDYQIIGFLLRSDADLGVGSPRDATARSHAPSIGYGREAGR